MLYGGCAVHELSSTSAGERGRCRSGLNGPPPLSGFKTLPGSRGRHSRARSIGRSRLAPAQRTLSKHTKIAQSPSVMRHNKSLEWDFATQAAPTPKAPSTQALGITKYSIVTNSNDSVTLRLATEHDLAMLYEWLNDLISSSGAEKKHARHLLTYRNSTCQAF